MTVSQERVSMDTSRSNSSGSATCLGSSVGELSGTEQQLWNQMLSSLQAYTPLSEESLEVLLPMAQAARPEIQEQTEIGRGKFGYVCGGVMGGQAVAVKRSDFMTPDELLATMFADEVVSSVACAHSNIVKTIGWFLETSKGEDGSDMFRTVLVMEKMGCK
eukprot:gene1214-32555_t